MPANLPPQYYEAEKQYRQARSAAEKIEALETMLAIMPKHKGTDHLKGELRAKIARLQEEGDRRGGGTRTELFQVRREGAGQAVLVGPPNVGKSQILAAVTSAAPKVADYPYTTQTPMPGMMPFENVQIQLIDLPPVDMQSSAAWMRRLIRQADLLLLVADLSNDPLADLENSLRELASMRVAPIEPGEEPGVTEEMVSRKRALVVGTKLDLPDTEEALELLKLECEGRFPVVGVAAATGADLAELRRAVFDALSIVRVHTKAPGQKVDLSDPVILPRGATIEDVAVAIHKDIGQKLRYAVIWGSGKFSGQRVGRAHVVEDGDIVELVT